MGYFTQENKRPSARTIELIRQVAYSYRVVSVNGRNEVYSLN